MNENKSLYEGNPNKKYLILIGFIVLVIILGAIYFIFLKDKSPGQIPEEQKDYSKYYYFPENYTQIPCIYITHIVGETNGTCFVTPKNDSYIVKDGSNYTSYNAVSYQYQ